MAEHRRAKVVGRATQARQTVGATQNAALGRMKSKVRQHSAENAAASEILVPESLENPVSEPGGGGLSRSNCC